MNGKFSLCCLIMFALFMVSCNQEGEKSVPASLVDKQKMIEVLTDVYRTEAKVAAMTIPYDSSQKVFDLVEKDLLAKHGVSDSAYRISMKYYFDSPEELSYIYEAVVDSLSLQEKKLTQQDRQTER